MKSDENDFDMHWRAIQIMGRRFHQNVGEQEDWREGHSRGELAYQSFYKRFPEYKNGDT